MPLRTIIIKATRSGTASTVIIRRGASGTGGGTGDHGALTGLGDDDHTQYLNNTRGDARYAKLTGATFTGPITAQSITGDGGALIVESSLDIQGNVTIPNGDLRLDDPTGAGITCNGPIIADSLALLTTPLPISSGGTGGSSQPAAWTGLGGGGTIASPAFTSLAIGGGTAISATGTTGAALVAAGTVAEADVILGTLKKRTTGTVSRDSNGTGSTFTDDPTLNGWTLAANTSYRIEYSILYDCGAGGIKTQFTTPSHDYIHGGNIGHYSMNGTAAAALVLNSTAITSGSRTSATSGTGTIAAIVGYIEFRTTVAGTLNFQWAQSSSNTAATRIFAGSVIKVIKQF
jgi:hypothetical protein